MWTSRWCRQCSQFCIIWCRPYQYHMRSLLWWALYYLHFQQIEPHVQNAVLSTLYYLMPPLLWMPPELISHVERQYHQYWCRHQQQQYERSEYYNNNNNSEIVSGANNNSVNYGENGGQVVVVVILFIDIVIMVTPFGMFGVYGPQALKFSQNFGVKSATNERF